MKYLMLLTSQVPTIVSGTINLITDAIFWGSMIVSGACVCYLIWHAVLWYTSDEQEQKALTQRMKKAVFILVFGLCVGGIVTIVSSYYS